jgi:predicted DNA-binding protein (MmcQ/YjbR family)
MSTAKTSAKKARGKKVPSKKAPAKKAPAKKAPAKKAPAKKTSAVRGPARRADDEATFAKVRALCLALPDTKLTMSWGSPHFRVGEKIFCGFGAENHQQVMGVKLGPSHARKVVKDPRFWPAPYVGKHGWVSMDVARRKSWDEVAALIRESYELVASKASRAKLR